MITRLSTMLKFKHRLGLLLLAVVLILVTALPASASSPQAMWRVRIIDFAFRPRSIVVAVGDTVTWANFGAVAHTTTSDTGVWDSGTLTPGQRFSFTFTAAGTYMYHCTFHPNMTARVIVQ